MATLIATLLWGIVIVAGLWVIERWHWRTGAAWRAFRIGFLAFFLISLCAVMAHFSKMFIAR